MFIDVHVHVDVRYHFICFLKIVKIENKAKQGNMAIVEDEIHNDSEDENEIEVVVEEDDAEQDSDDSDDDDDDEVLEHKVTELERNIAENPYNYDEHIELIQALWNLSELDRWRAAFIRLQEMSLLKPEHWLMRLQTEESLAHSAESRKEIATLFQEAALDCYSIPILSEWCSWSIGGGVTAAREQLEEVLRRAGADPLSGKVFWDARLDLEKAHLESLSESDAEIKTQKERILWCLEEIVSRPLLRCEEAWQQFEEMALQIHDQKYVEKIKKQHDIAAEYLQKITPFEDNLLTLEDVEEKLKVYQDYIDTVKKLSRDDKYAECDSNGILKVLYERATTECLSCEGSIALLREYARSAHRRSSRTTYARVLEACSRRSPRRANFWLLRLQHAEHENKEFEQVKSIFETALSKGMESYKESEALWLGYLEYIRRCTTFDQESDLERLRRTFRLAWDSLAEAWGEEANDSEIPLYWARLEYTRMKDPKQGKEIFEEIFKYGENKTMSKYWEAFIYLESNRDPRLSENKLRDLYRRALKFVNDYPPAVTRLWTDYERDFGHLDTMRECSEACEDKLKEWRQNYQSMKEKLTYQKQKGKQLLNKKTKSDKKNLASVKSNNKGKRKSDENDAGSEVKKKKDVKMDVDVKAEGVSGGLKRSHETDNNNEGSTTKRQRRESSSSSINSTTREACTLFVSNLPFKAEEDKLRDKLSEYGDIVSLRLKAGVKAFGGSICYCQYTTPESVDEALKHDRIPLDGRPMFFSRYSSKKGNPTFKYATTVERNKLFVRNLPFSHCTKEALTEIFDKYGKLKDVRIVAFKDGKPKGLAYIDYEDEKAASEALSKTNGMVIADKAIEVAVSAPPPRADSTILPTLGQPKRDSKGGMRRTQISSFIPSVLQKASTSKASSNGQPEKQPLNNADFRNMLLGKK